MSFKKISNTARYIHGTIYFMPNVCMGSKISTNKIMESNVIPTASHLVYLFPCTTKCTRRLRLFQYPKRKIGLPLPSNFKGANSLNLKIHFP